MAIYYVSKLYVCDRSRARPFVLPPTLSAFLHLLKLPLPVTLARVHHWHWKVHPFPVFGTGDIFSDAEGAPL